jgi:TRAP-type C4-dicarboxylate transport system substrate-binding protein
MKKRLIGGMIVATMLFVVVGGAFAQKEIKLGHIAAPNTAYDNWAKEFKRQVEEASNNKYKIIIYGGGQLGGSTALMEGLQAGNNPVGSYYYFRYKPVRQRIGCTRFAVSVPELGSC